MGGRVSQAGQGFYRSEIQYNFKKYYNLLEGSGAPITLCFMLEDAKGHCWGHWLHELQTGVSQWNVRCTNDITEP